MDHKLWPSREAYDLAVADAILKSGADTVALAGYMRMLTAGFLNAFPHRVVNVHPALLPSFPGIHGAADAQAWGVKITGCTVHLVDEIMDHGEVIIQAAVPAIAASRSMISRAVSTRRNTASIRRRSSGLPRTGSRWTTTGAPCISCPAPALSPLPLPACSSARRLRKAFRGRKILMVLEGERGPFFRKAPSPPKPAERLAPPAPKAFPCGLQTDSG